MRCKRPLWPALILLTPSHAFSRFLTPSHAFSQTSSGTLQTSTLAGSGSAAYAEGAGASAAFNFPSGVTVTPDGSIVVVADRNNHRIRLIQLSSGTTSLLAGSGAQQTTDGVGASASFDTPSEVAVSPDGASVAVGEQGHGVRLIALQTGTVTTLASSQIWGVTFSPDGANVFFVTRATGGGGQHEVRSVSMSDGTMVTVAGSGAEGAADGVGNQASFKQPMGIETTPDGKYLIVAECGGGLLRAVELATFAVTTMAGSGATESVDGTGASASFKYLAAVAVSPDGSTVYAISTGSHVVRAIAVPQKQ